MFVNIFIYLMPCDLFEILLCSIDDRIDTFGSHYSKYCTLDVVGNLPFDHIFLMEIHQTLRITSDRAVL
jgi:hypothetical protein